jgi:chromosome segregation ATPase
MFGKKNNPQTTKAPKRGKNAFAPQAYEPTDFGGLELLHNLTASAGAQYNSLAPDVKTIRDTASLLEEKASAAITAANLAATAHEEAEANLDKTHTAENTAKDNVRTAGNAANDAERELGFKRDDLETAKRPLAGLEEDFVRAKTARNEAETKLGQKQTERDNAKNALFIAETEHKTLELSYNTLKKLFDAQTNETVKTELGPQVEEANGNLQTANGNLNEARTAFDNAETAFGQAEREFGQADTACETANGNLSRANNKATEAELALQTAEDNLKTANEALEAAKREQADAEKAVSDAVIALELAKIRAEAAAEKRDILEQLSNFAAFNANITDRNLAYTGVVRDNASDIEQHILSLEGAYDETKYALEAANAALEQREGTINTMRADTYQNDYFMQPAPVNGFNYAALPAAAQNPANSVLTVPVIELKHGKIVQK